MQISLCGFQLKVRTQCYNVMRRFYRPFLWLDKKPFLTALMSASAYATYLYPPDRIYVVLRMVDISTSYPCCTKQLSGNPDSLGLYFDVSPALTA